MSLNKFFLRKKDKILQLETEHHIHFKDVKFLKDFDDNSVHLIITSPPYWKIKDYGNKDQIGFHDDVDTYFSKLSKVWKECVRVLNFGCKICINIVEQFIRTTKHKPYHIVPLYSILLSEIEKQFRGELFYLGSIFWQKVSTSDTSGGGKVMGSYLFPRSGYFFTNREFIAIFRKKGKEPKVSRLIKQKSKLTKQEWKMYFKDTWSFRPETQDIHDAMFPDELPKRLIKMYSFVGDTVLDPFLGSGTTSKMASALGRNSIGFEIGFNRDNWKEIVKNKIESGFKLYNAKYYYYD